MKSILEGCYAIIAVLGLKARWRRGGYLMKTAVVIPTCKRPLMVEQLLDSLAQCAFPPSLDIYVVENGVRSGTEDVCKASPIGNRVRYLYSASAGKTPALNLAIQASNADFFIFFDDDVRVSTGI